MMKRKANISLLICAVCAMANTIPVIDEVLGTTKRRTVDYNSNFIAMRDILRLLTQTDCVKSFNLLPRQRVHS
jgi:hypothetical protein